LVAGALPETAHSDLNLRSGWGDETNKGRARNDLRKLKRDHGPNRLKQARVNGVNNEILEAAMTRFARFAPALAAATILAATALPASAAAVAKSNFDGQWSVLIVTQKGTCDRAYRYPVKISNGSVGYAGDASFNVSGKVGENGTLTVTVSRGSQSAKGQGRLSATDGSGMWTAGSGECSGTWTAERRSS
jgi:hypothetical protein